MHESMEIRAVNGAEIPRDLLLQADPSATRVKAYLASARCFVSVANGEIIGAAVLQAVAPRVWELMNISVAAGHQQHGIGSALLLHAIDVARAAGVVRVEVGTGSFGYQLRFYQRHGFRVEAIAKDFFLTHYDEPVCEDGIRLKDMLRLALVLA